MLWQHWPQRSTLDCVSQGFCVKSLQDLPSEKKKKSMRSASAAQRKIFDSFKISSDFFQKFLKNLLSRFQVVKIKTMKIPSFRRIPTDLTSLDVAITPRYGACFPSAGRPSRRFRWLGCEAERLDLSGLLVDGGRPTYLNASCFLLLVASKN